MSPPYSPGPSRRATVASGVSLEYVEQGDPTALPLVLLPGFTDSWLSFTTVLPELPPDLHVLAVSQRGHGASSRPRTGYRPVDYARDVVAFLDALGIERAVLVGHSSSTFTARLVASGHPRRTVGLVLIASPLTLRGNPAAAALAASPELASPKRSVPEEFVRRFVTATVGPSVSTPFLEAMVMEAAKVPARVWRDTFRGLLEHDDTGTLRQILLPTLLVWGDADDLVTRADQEALGNALPSSRLLVYAGIGHSPHWEDPQRFAVDVTAFVHGLMP